MEIKNAIIDAVSMRNDDHGGLSIWITLNYGDSGQGFGGFNLYSKGMKSTGNYAGHFIWRVMEVVGVYDWDDLKGKPVRVKSEYNKVHEIGNIIEDKWYNPSKEFEVM